MSFEIVTEFENRIAKFYNAPFAVSTDCCTHAIELCLRLHNVADAVSPKHNYISVPFTFEKLGLNWKFENLPWQDYYYVTENIIDAAVYWQRDGYIPNTFMCLSFQYKKHLSLSRGGMILCSNEEDYLRLKKLSYDGRVPEVFWEAQDIDTVGYHYYMTPETAQLGLDKLELAVKTDPKTQGWKNYPDLSTMKVFK